MCDMQRISWGLMGMREWALLQGLLGAVVSLVNRSHWISSILLDPSSKRLPKCAQANHRGEGSEMGGAKNRRNYLRFGVVYWNGFVFSNTQRRMRRNADTQEHFMNTRYWNLSPNTKPYVLLSGVFTRHRTAPFRVCGVFVYVCFIYDWFAFCVYYYRLDITVKALSNPISLLCNKTIFSVDREAVQVPQHPQFNWHLKKA